MVEFDYVCRSRGGSPVRGQSGFTLIELMIVVCIVGILAGIAVPHVEGLILKAKEAKRVAQKENFKSATLAYFSDHNAWPSSGIGSHCFAPSNVTCFWSNPGSDAMVATFAPYVDPVQMGSGPLSSESPYNYLIYVNDPVSHYVAMWWTAEYSAPASHCPSGFATMVGDFSHKFCNEIFAPYHP